MIERIVVKGRLPDSFFELPTTIYRDLPFAPEENREKVQRLLTEERANYDTVLYTDHRTVRLLGIFPKHADTAYFAYWEAGNPETNQLAFKQFEDDVAQRKINRIRGPLTFNTFHRYRLRQQTPSWTMFDREPVNPEYYLDWLTVLGYTPVLTFESRMMRSSDMPRLYESKEHYLATLTDLPFRYLPLTPENWTARAYEIYELVDAIFSQNPGYQRISYAQFCHLYDEVFARQLCPHSSVLLEDHVSKKLIGMSFCLPNYRWLNPKRPPTFAQDYLWLPHKTLLIKSVGIHPDFRQRGLMTYLGAYCMQTFQEYYEDAIFCLMREDNPSRSFTADLPYECCSYALFEKTITHS